MSRVLLIVMLVFGASSAFADMKVFMKHAETAGIAKALNGARAKKIKGYKDWMNCVKSSGSTVSVAGKDLPCKGKDSGNVL